MTPEKDKTLKADDASVALKEDDERLVTDEPRGKASPEDAGAPTAQAQSGAPGGQEAQGEGSDSVKKAEFQEITATPVKDGPANMDLLLDVVVPVSVVLGRTSLTVKDILSTSKGSVIELSRAAGDPVDILVGGKPLAKGEVVVVKDRFGVRITELIGSIEGAGQA
jgi:flagellar motor switch protein FliN/FliY